MSSDRATRPGPTRRVQGLAALCAGYAFGGLVYGLAQRWTWTLGWLYLGIMGAAIAINLAVLLRCNPELIARRMQIGEGTKTWDKVWSGLSGLVWIALYAVAVLELREAPARVPGPGWLAGMALFVPSWALVVWSMAVNPFFEKTVRIQTERAHHVIDTGPYASVRHPGYVGFAGWLLATPLLLGSDRAFVPAVLALILLVVRTELEDRTLRAELSGYSEYASRVRFRLVPGVW